MGPFPQIMMRLSKRLQRWKAEGKQDAFSRAGATEMTFLNIVDGVREMDNMVDLNGRMRGMQVPGQLLSALAELTRGSPEIATTPNPPYVNKIRAAVRTAISG